MSQENTDLSKYVKYARDYLNISRGFRKNINASKLDIDISKYFDLIGLLNGDLDGEIQELVKIEEFYNAKSEEEKEIKEYRKQEKVAQQLENLIFKYKNNEFTQELRLSFCNITYNGRRTDPETGELTEFEKIEQPLCSIGITINKNSKTGQYFFETSDDQILVHIDSLWHFVDEKIYYQLTKILTEREKSGSLFLPKDDLSFLDDLVLELKSAVQTAENLNFVGSDLTVVRASIEPKSNYFLVEDLESLSKIESDDLEGSALSIWTEEEKDAQSTEDDKEVKSERELFFPFPYDKFKLKTLPLLRSRVSIIEGPPGTGKSELIANTLVHLAAHNKKVLFVSQKSQALKVVKDKLKTLEVEGLFAYFPNKQSAQLSESDHNDSVTAAFSKIEQSLSLDVSMKEKNDITQPFSKIEAGRERFAEYFKRQREIYEVRSAITQKYKVYEDLNLDSSNLNVKNWETLTALFKNKLKLEEEIKNFETDRFEEIDEIEFTEEIVSSVKAISQDFSKTAHDRNNSLFRSGNNFVRRFRNVSDFKTLPNEINGEIKKIEKQYTSRHKASKQMEQIFLYVEFKYNEKLLNEHTMQISKDLKKLKISDVQLVELINLQRELSLNSSEFISEIDDYITLQKKMFDLGVHDFEPNNFSSNEHRYFTEKKEKIKLYLRNILKQRSSKMLDDRKILKTVRQLAKAFSKSKKAFKTFDKLKQDPDSFLGTYSLFPVWIMELDDASRILPLQKDLFDYIILDESSQCNIAYTLPAMYRASKAVFVGDSKQMKDTTTGFISNRILNQLAEKYEIPEHMQIKPQGEAVMSVLDIFKLQGVKSKTLQYHYRSPKELINFSSENFYKPSGTPLISLNKEYLTYKDTRKVIVKHKIDVDYSIETSERTNRSEALKSLDLYHELRATSGYENLSIGILTFFNDQASEIQSVFSEANVRDENLLISTIEGVQGDEKDIIIYSFAIKTPEEKNRYVALTGENGDVRKEVNNGRVNVAFSRAKKQVHIITSIETNKFPDGIWLKKYLKYADDYGEVDAGKTELQDFDSYFEEEFYALLSDELSDKYLIQNQVKSLGFKIDFVITNLKTGKKLAIECDGPSHFADERSEEFGEYIDNDIERQLTLESAGWHFYRVPYSVWLKTEERKRIVDEIKMLS